MKALQRGIDIFGESIFLALSYFTRIPIPRKVNPEYFPYAIAWLPLIGALVAGVTILVSTRMSFIAFEGYLPGLVIPAYLILVIGPTLLTGSFHEDGLADSADGLIGGMTKERRLEIMKDSCIGTHGTIALWALLTFRLVAIWFFSVGYVQMLIPAHTMGRAGAVVMAMLFPYVRSGSDSKAGPIVKGASRWFSLLGLVVALGFSYTYFSVSDDFWISLLFTCLIIPLGWGLYCKRMLGGITGDTLGAACVFGEVAVLIVAWPLSEGFFLIY